MSLRKPPFAHACALATLFTVACAAPPESGGDAGASNPDAADTSDAASTPDASLSGEETGVVEGDAGASDASQGQEEDTGADPDAGGVQLGDPAPPGPPPELDPDHPLRDVGAFERVLPDELIGSVENLQWLHETAQLQFALGKGGRGSVPVVEEGDPGPQLHPYSMWTLQAFTDGERAWESMRLPALRNGRGETHWCNLVRSRGETWCNHNLKKASEALIRVNSGDGITQPLAFDSWNLPGSSHSNLYTFAETSGGALYIVYKKGIINAKSWMYVLDPEDILSGGVDFDDAMVRVTDPCMEQPDGATVCVPSQDIVGVAISPDEQTVYFTTGGYHTDGGVGALWSAPRMADGALGAPSLLVGSVPDARGVTVDERGNLYVASRHTVRVYNPAGQELGVLDVVTDQAHLDELNTRNGQKYTLLSVAFGGPHFNTLYAGLGFDRKGTENIDNPTNFTLGGLFRVEIKARGAWAARHGITPPQ